ncbi:MAG: hypothetical protein H0W69_04970 [Gemmatimonadaceae bacterium]|nr:hypothetical protein [Gemmatimonadaceae bacterium]
MTSVIRAAALASIITSVLAATRGDAQGCARNAQVRTTQLAGPGADYVRLMELADTSLAIPLLARRLSDNVSSPRCSGELWSPTMGYATTLNRTVTVMPFSLASTYNSAIPVDRNNGSMWAGRGLSAGLQGGAIFRAGPVTIGALPEFSYQQNRGFDSLPRFTDAVSGYASGLYYQIDLPQRFGPDSYINVDAGQSYVRLDGRNIGVGLSNENIWWGPGISNAILFTNTAPGFPHLFAKTRSPFNIGIGRLGLEAFWGRATESDYFDSDPTNDHDMISSSLITFVPHGTRGLTLAFGRTFTLPWDSVGTRTFTRLLQPFLAKSLSTTSNPQGHSVDDQRLSFLARYVLPASQFELYGEWAREDASYDTPDLISELEHSSGHVIGLVKGFNKTSDSFNRFYAEVTNLQSLRQDRPGIRPNAPFYLHAPHGHTQRGQLLGASIGPGGESQLVGMDFFRKWGLGGFFLERVRRDEFSLRAQYFWTAAFPPLHDVELTGGVRWTRQLGPMRFDGSFSTGKRRNRNFLRNETNKELNAAFTWTPGS